MPDVILVYCPIAEIALMKLRSTNAEQLFERGTEIAIEDYVGDWVQRFAIYAVWIARVIHSTQFSLIK